MRLIRISASEAAQLATLESSNPHQHMLCQICQAGVTNVVIMLNNEACMVVVE